MWFPCWIFPPGNCPTTWCYLLILIRNLYLTNLFLSSCPDSVVLPKMSASYVMNWQKQCFKVQFIVCSYIFFLSRFILSRFYPRTLAIALLTLTFQFKQSIPLSHKWPLTHYIMQWPGPLTRELYDSRSWCGFVKYHQTWVMTLDTVV